MKPLSISVLKSLYGCFRNMLAKVQNKAKKFVYYFSILAYMLYQQLPPQRGLDSRPN